jgi:hypothetical protein
MIMLDLPQDPALLAAIGKVAVRYGQLEYGLKLTIKSILGISIPDALAATERKTSHQLRESIVKEARRRFGDGLVLVSLKALLEKSREATNRRNSLLHGLWATELNGRQVHRASGHILGPIPPVAELDALADELYLVGKELNQERRRGFLHQAMQASPAVR